MRASAQQGNVIFIILIAVTLFGALSYAITQSGRGSGSISREQAQLDAAVLEQCIAYVERGVKMLEIVHGCPTAQISYELPDGSNENTDNPSDTSCFVFHSDGAGLTACGTYLDIIAPACTGQSVGGHCWYYGAAGQSCTAVCTAAGKTYSTQTQSYGAANNAQCGTILTALGAGGSGNSDTVNDCGWNLGCYYSPPGWDNQRARCINNTATAGASWAGARRACACE